MKTLTAKLAVAALLVAGVAQANVPVLSTGMFVINANDAIQTASANWYATQKNATKVQRYGVPAAQLTAAALLAARANGYADCRACAYTPEFVKNNFTPNAALAGLTLLTVGKYLYSNRTDAQVAADAAVVAAVQAQAQSSDKAKRS